MIPVLEPYINERERNNLDKAIESGWISSIGKFIIEFESNFKSLYSCERFVTSVSNGTAAIELALKSIGIGRGKRVLVPNFTFGATLNAVLNVGAEPILFEPSVGNWNIDTELCKFDELLASIDAIILVSIYGVPINTEVFEYLKENHPCISIVEDCAESFGTQYDNDFTGSMADVATFSFFGNKTITTGEGGMVVFRDREAYERSLLIKNHGMSPDKKYTHVVGGSNYRMTNLQASIGVAQLEKANFIFEKKNVITAQYYNNLKNVDFQSGVDREGTIIWLNTILFKTSKERDRVVGNFIEKEIDFRLPFSPMNTQPAFSEFLVKGFAGAALDIFQRGISLPSAVTLDEPSQLRVIEAVNEIT